MVDRSHTPVDGFVAHTGRGMTVGNVEVRVGGRIWFDGQGWEVCEFADGVVRLTDGGRVRAVSVAALLSSLHDLPRAEGDSQSTDEPTDMWTIPAIMLAALSTRQLGVLEAKLAVLRRVLEPDPDDERSLGQRYEDLAAELRVSRRTLERQVSRLVSSARRDWSTVGCCRTCGARSIPAGTVRACRC